MGTRHLIIIFYKGQYRIIQYGQWDGYIEGQGYRIYKFLMDPSNITNLKEGLENVYVPNQEELAEISKWIDDTQNQYGRDWETLKNLMIDKYPSFSRDTSSDLLYRIAILAGTDTKMPVRLEGLSFIFDFLFCEFAYVIDLDNAKLEVYHGPISRDQADKSHRFYDYKSSNDEHPPRHLPCTIFECPFDELPADKHEFYSLCKEGMGDDDESS